MKKSVRQFDQQTTSCLKLFRGKFSLSLPFLSFPHSFTLPFLTPWIELRRISVVRTHLQAPNHSGRLRNAAENPHLALRPRLGIPNSNFDETWFLIFLRLLQCFLHLSLRGLSQLSYTPIASLVQSPGVRLPLCKLVYAARDPVFHTRGAAMR